MCIRDRHAGYSRDLQDDRRATLGSGPIVAGALRAVALAVPHVTFDRDACLRAVSDGGTQATDLAEALVRAGTPFRDAYRAVGALVRDAATSGRTLAATTLAQAQHVHPAFTKESLAALDPRRAVAAKESVGGTGPRSVDLQLAALEAEASAIHSSAKGDSFANIAENIASFSL